MTQLFRDVAGKSLCRPQNSVVCIGAFDGLHRGHQALVGHALSRARVLGLPLVALSFEPLPREFFARGETPPRLTLPLSMDYCFLPPARGGCKVGARSSRNTFQLTETHTETSSGRGEKHHVIS